ncbi:maltose permease [Paramyrothecium foliicola]|nr:maltose permease [Paramyrothecium foliicola]
MGKHPGFNNRASVPTQHLSVHLLLFSPCPEVVNIFDSLNNRAFEMTTQDSTTAGPLPQKVDIEHVDDVTTRIDHEMTPWQCIRKNPKAVMWTIYANRLNITSPGDPSTSKHQVGEADLQTIYRQKFAADVNGELIISARWQASWSAAFNVMQLFGSLTGGFVQDSFGRRASYLVGIIVMCGGIATAYLSETSEHFLAAKIVTGFGIGMVLATTQTYVSEITPMPMRGVALSFSIVMLNIGFLIAISSTFSRVSIMDPSAFRVIFAAAWAFPGLMAIGLPFLPESPYWLVIQGKQERARVALKRLAAPYEDIDARLQQIQETVDDERRQSSGSSSILECFQGINWRRTRIILICMYMPQVLGAVLAANAPYFLNQTGLSSNTVVLVMQVGCAVSVVSSIVNIVALMKMPQRPLMFFGVGICISIYLIMGVAACLPQSPKTLMAIGFSLQFTSLAYGPAVGSAYAIAGEVSATRLRAKSQGIAFSWQAIVSTAWSVVLPYMYNKDEANMGGHIGWVFLGMAIIMVVVVYFDVPATKGRTFQELDEMFERRVPARQFRKFKF